MAAGIANQGISDSAPERSSLMGLDPSFLPDKFLSKMAKADRAPLGKAESASVGSKAPITNLVIAPSTDEQRLNKTERAWLRQLQLTHPSTHIGVQSLTLKLGDDCRYTPDFWTIDANGQLIFWEVKGFWRDDALVKIKTAARMFRWARFIVITKDKTGFNERPVSP